MRNLSLTILACIVLVSVKAQVNTDSSYYGITALSKPGKILLPDSTGHWTRTTAYNPAYMDEPAKYDTVKCWFKELRVVISDKPSLYNGWRTSDSTIVEIWQHGFQVTKRGKGYQLWLTDRMVETTHLNEHVVYLYSDKTKVNNKVIYSYEK